MRRVPSALADDEAAVFEHAQVLGDRWAGDRQVLGQLPDRAGVTSEQLEDGASGRVAEQPQTFNSVSVH